MKMTATRLRAELYRVLDRLLETGEAVEIVRPQGTVVLKAARFAGIRRKVRKPKSNPDLVVGNPDVEHGLEVARDFVDEGSARVIDLSFTRDPYDRLIAGHALAAKATLLTADENILRNVSCARWG